MNILRSYIRNILLETVAIDADIFVKKLKKFDKGIKHPEHLNINVRPYIQNHNLIILEGTGTPYPAPKTEIPEFETHKEKLSWLRSDIGRSTITHRPRIDMDYVKSWKVEVKKYLENRYFEFAKRRGWNLLNVQVVAEMVYGPVPVYKMRVFFDQTPHVDVTGIYGIASELSNSYLYHMTNSSVVEKIMSSGFKPSKKSSDGKTFGNGRGYFVIIDKNVSEDEILAFFQEMAGEFGFAGVKGKQSYMKIDPTKIKGNIKFYKDSEWSQGTGKIPTKKTSINAIAVYTPTFISANTIIEVIDL